MTKPLTRHIRSCSIVRVRNVVVHYCLHLSLASSKLDAIVLLKAMSHTCWVLVAQVDHSELVDAITAACGRCSCGAHGSIESEFYNSCS